MSNKSELIITKTVKNATLGNWINPFTGFSNSIGQLVPFCKGQEDIEVLLKYIDILNEVQPIEYCGYPLHTTIEKAAKISNEIYYEYGIDAFHELTKHPGLVSYPPEVIWLAHEGGMKQFKKSIAENLSKMGTGFTKQNAIKFSKIIYSLIEENPKTLQFWEQLDQNFEGEPYAKILTDFTAYTASRFRAKVLTGLLPLIDDRHTSSIRYTRDFNEMIALEVKNLREVRAPAPDFYFFTLNFNSTLFKDSNWTNELDATVKMVNHVLGTNKELYDGLFVNIRGLDRISKDIGRVSVVIELARRLIKICLNLKIPLWFSKFGIPGLALLDLGANYCSAPINMNIGDVYITGRGFFDPDLTYGKIYHPNLQRKLGKKEVLKVLEKNGEMPTFHHNVPTKPLLTSENSPKLWRVTFGKPINIANIADLSKKWQKNVNNDEEEPGKIYLSRCGSLYQTWGKRW